MSLDIWLNVEGEAESVSEKNMTHNLCPMWKEAGIYDVLYNSEGKTANEVIPTLETGLSLMVSDPYRFKKLNARNGWGTYNVALPWLAELVAEFKAYPDGKIGVSI